MEPKEWTFMNKEGWGDGPWQEEPDKLQWTDAETGLPCLIVRNGVGALCGYVGVSEGHPLFMIKYSDCSLPHAKPRGERPQDKEPVFGRVMPESMLQRIRERRVCDGEWCGHTPEHLLEVHGGITFSDFCQPDREHGICHFPSPGEPERVWWLGFDCAHSGDLSPKMNSHLSAEWQERFGDRDTYRTVAYVQAQCAQLARQLAALQPSSRSRRASA